MKLADFGTSWHDMIHATGAQWLAFGFGAFIVVTVLVLAVAHATADAREHVREDKPERIRSSVRIGPFSFWKD